jgi:hypothetical protein
MLMKSASLVQLLKDWHLLYQNYNIQKPFLNVKHEFSKDEMNAILQIILGYMGILQRKDYSLHIENMDHYEYVKKMFWRFCHDKISDEEMVDVINVLKTDEVQIIEIEGSKVTIYQTTDSISLLSELKNHLHLKRRKLNKYMLDVTDFIGTKIKMISVALEEQDT